MSNNYEDEVYDDYDEEEFDTDEEEKKKRPLPLILISILVIGIIFVLIGIIVTKNTPNNQNILIKIDLGNGIIQEQSQLSGEKIKLPETPQKAGYKFIEWQDENGNIITEDYIVNNETQIKAIWKQLYECPENCVAIGDGSKCVITEYVDYDTTTTCPNGYENRDGSCYNFNNRYYADFSGTEPSCRGDDLKYEEEFGMGVDIWCAPKAEMSTNQTCPPLFEDNGNNCQKEEKIDCTSTD